jgi:hypothetical protein
MPMDYLGEETDLIERIKQKIKNQSGDMKLP